MNDKVKTVKDIKQYLESHDPKELVEGVHEVVTNVKTLFERIQDIVTENEFILALFDVTVIAGIRTAGSLDGLLCIGEPEQVKYTLADIQKKLCDELGGNS